MFCPSYSLTSNFPLNPLHKSLLPSLNPLQSTKQGRTIILASNREADGPWDPLHDNINDDMIILRKRIHEIKMEEELDPRSSDWMQWEKDYYETTYAADVCNIVGSLQVFCMNTRPSLAIGSILLLFLTVPTSLWFLLHRLLDAFGPI